MMNLTILACQSCGFQAIPPKYTCPSCHEESLSELEIPGKGKVFSHTTIRVAPGAFASEIPYPILLVELENGLRVTARTDLEQVLIGQVVQLKKVEKGVYWFG